ncbi:MAG: hypothetical protein JKY37_00310 [Nannocystaceae bacterium]|nr:hypothetical protein [Nannocystaceae bacterium]
MNCRLGLGMGLLAMFVTTSVAHALPTEISDSGTEDDASLTLTMLDTLITSDPLVWCRIEIEIDTMLVEFTEDDTITVSLYEDDVVFNDLVWTNEIVLTADDAAQTTYEAEFDCSAMGMRDGVGQLEFYAQVEVDKDLCGITCFNDNPTTGNLDVVGLADDDQEEDDNLDMAMPAVLDAVQELIAADDDVVRVTLPGPGAIEADIAFMSECGEVELEIVDDSGTVVSETSPTDGGVMAVADPLGAGAYFIVTRPADQAGFNFYDIDVTRIVDDEPGDDSGGSDGADGSDDDAGPDSGADGTGSADGGPDGGGPDGGGPDGGGPDGGDNGAESGDGTGSSDGGGGQAGDDDGCGCSQTPSRQTPLWLTAFLFTVLIRRRRSAARR